MKIRYSDLHKTVHRDEVALDVPVSHRTRSRRTSWDEALARFAKEDSAEAGHARKQDENQRASSTSK
jgi:hypothetical protein